MERKKKKKKIPRTLIRRIGKYLDRRFFNAELTISYSFLHITLRSFHSQLCKHIVHPSTRTLQKFFRKGQGFRHFAKVFNSDGVTIISNKLDQPPPIFSESINSRRNIVSINRKSLSKKCSFSATNSSRLDT